ncbi:hypothetical protein K9M74_00285 [Candidatus Woesearchaeota archaeon]|nr:hypothetical protein [Candidatus Woesearchaeota archaeon]
MGAEQDLELKLAAANNEPWDPEKFSRLQSQFGEVQELILPEQMLREHEEQIRNNFGNNKLYHNHDIELEEMERVVDETQLRAQKSYQQMLDAKERTKKVKEEKGQLTYENNQLKLKLGQQRPTAQEQFSTTYYGKFPPQAMDVEEKILSTYLQQPELMQEQSQPWINLQWYQESHKLIHQAMMHIQGKLTPTTLIEHLRKKERLEEVGGARRLKELEKSAQKQDFAALQDYLAILERKYLGREVIRYATDVANAMFQEEPFIPYADPEITKRQEQVENLRQKLKRNPPKQYHEMSDIIREISFQFLELLPYKDRRRTSVADIVDEVSEDLEALLARKGAPRISTGYKELDAVTHGIRGNKLILFGGRGKQGKTTLSTVIADNVAQQTPVVIFTYESTKTELVQKLIAKRAKIDLEKFEYYDPEKNNFTATELKRYRKAAQEVKKLPLYIEGGKPDLNYLTKVVKRYKILHPNLQLVVVDGLQAFDYERDKSREIKSYHLDNVLTTLKKDVAEEYHMTVIVNAQLKGTVETYKGKKPRGVGDFSDSKSITEVADLALLLYRPEHYYPENPDFHGWMNIQPVAMRSGDTKEVQKEKIGNEEREIIKLRQFRLGIDIKHADITQYKKSE